MSSLTKTDYNSFENLAQQLEAFPLAACIKDIL